MNKVEHGPGVGKFYPNDVLLRRIPSAVISISLDLKKQASEDTPGPAKYFPEEFGSDSRSHFSKTRQMKNGFLFNKATSRNRKEAVPGPGTYDDHVSKGNQLIGSANAVIGTSRRFQDKLPETHYNPGPA